ncbi:MAG: serine hydrolase domain-containing protein [Phycisphaerales bacterium]
MSIKNTLVLPLIAAAVVSSAHADRSDVRRAVVRARASGVLHGSVLAGSADRPVRTSKGSIAEPDGDDIDADTRFRIASLTKLFTQVAALRLAKSGRLNLDAPVGAYRPELQAPWKDTVTIRQLLAMTSGLPRELNGSPERGVEYDDAGLAGAYLDAHAGIALESDPGTRSAYSNLGYWLVGAAIEAVTGKSYVDAVNELVLTPLGADPVALSPMELGADGLAAPHRSGDRGCERAPDYPVDQRYSSGGLVASAGQVHAVAVGIFDKEFLGAPSVGELFSQFGTEPEGRITTVAGMVPGFMNLVMIDRESESAVVSLNNCVAEDPNAFMASVRSIAEELGD